jgi:hypothetical protein
MKKWTAILILPFFCSCSKEVKTDKDDITTKWTDDGKTLIIERKGQKIGQITNVSNAYFVELSGTDSFPDLQVSYYEDEKTGLSPIPTSVNRSFLQDDGSVILISYDDEGKIKSVDKNK